jgi:hypothetical protein
VPLPEATAANAPEESVTMPLTTRQALWIAEYVKDLDATAAAVRAGYPERSAPYVGAANKRNPEIAAAIERVHNARDLLVQERIADAVGTEAWIVEKTAAIVEENDRDRVPALALLARRVPSFNGGDAQGDKHLHLHLPDGTTLDDLRRIASGA